MNVFCMQQLLNYIEGYVIFNQAIGIILLFTCVPLKHFISTTGFLDDIGKGRAASDSSACDFGLVYMIQNGSKSKSLH